jgi:hypothetical protein
MRPRRPSRSLKAALPGTEQWKQNRLVSLIRGNDRGHDLATASLALRVRLLEAPEAVTDRFSHAGMLCVIARAAELTDMRARLAPRA